MDMRAGAERLMSCVVNTTGAARAHHGYLFANARATRIKLLVHDGFGVWCAARRLNAGHFAWPARGDGRAAVVDADPVRCVDRGAAVATATRDERDHAHVIALVMMRVTGTRALTGLVPMA